MEERRGIASAAAFAVAVAVVALAVLVGTYVSTVPNGGGTTTTQTSTATSSGMQGVVTGYVTVGPSQPVCYANQTCNVNMTGYSLVFTPQCGASHGCQPEMAQLSPSGHYSILLPEGVYTVTGLSPSCNWMGCASAFPKTVTVEGGMQLVFDVDIDTGIR